ncbi:hypothetical protein SCA6_010272 [Theobroma cacao]
MGEEVELFGMWASAYNRRIELPLKLKGIPFEYIEEDLSSSGTQSYETRNNNPLLPQDPYERAMARFWAKFIGEKIQPTARKANLAEGKEREQAVGECCQQLEILENELHGRVFFGGDSIG